MADYTWRPATPADVDLLSELGRRTFLAAFGAANTPEDLAAYLPTVYAPDHQRREVADPDTTILLAEDHGTVAGYLKLVSGTTADGVVARAPIEVQRLYADLPYLGGGVGSFLMRAALDLAQARGHDVVWLAVWEHNQGARRFYARWGFTEVGEQPFVLGRDVQRDLVLVRSVARG